VVAKEPGLGVPKTIADRNGSSIRHWEVTHQCGAVFGPAWRAFPIKGPSVRPSAYLIGLRAPTKARRRVFGTQMPPMLKE
jgi:hypothetical protein